jgi:hypothetical protein
MICLAELLCEIASTSAAGQIEFRSICPTTGLQKLNSTTAKSSAIFYLRRLTDQGGP